MKIYNIFCSYGEYSSWQKDCILSFFSEERAEECVKHLNELQVYNKETQLKFEKESFTCFDINGHEDYAATTAAEKAWTETNYKPAEHLKQYLDIVGTFKSYGSNNYFMEDSEIKDAEEFITKEIVFELLEADKGSKNE